MLYLGENISEYTSNKYSHCFPLAAAAALTAITPSPLCKFIGKCIKEHFATSPDLIWWLDLIDDECVSLQGLIAFTWIAATTCS
jgi:hypothetical protein